MPDYGLLSGFAEGITKGMQSYRDTKKEAFDNAIKEKMMKMEELKTAGDLSDKLGYLPKGYFGDDTLKALGAQGPATENATFTNTMDRSSDPSLSDAPQNPADGLLPKPVASPLQESLSPLQAGTLNKPEGAISIPGTQTKRQHAEQDKLNQYNVSLNPQGKAARFDAKGNVEIYELPKSEKQTLEETKKNLDIENSKLDVKKAEKALSEPKENQFKAATFANRAEHGQQLYEQLAASGFDPSTLDARVQASLPSFLQAVKSDPVKMQELSEKEFISSVLRRESGAAISKDEYKDYGQQYFPRAGDSDDIKAAKAALRKDTVVNLKNEAGPAYRPSTKIKFSDPHNPSVTSHPQDSAALQWAKANPKDPRSAAIMKVNGL